MYRPVFKQVASLGLALSVSMSGALGTISVANAANLPETAVVGIRKGQALGADSRFRTNLEGLNHSTGKWEITDQGLHSYDTGGGDSFLFSTTSADNFIYQTDVKFNSASGAAALLFRSQSSGSQKDSYAVNMDAGNRKCKFWRWVDGADEQLIDEREVPEAADGIYTLKVVALGDWISYYVNGTLIASTGDYVLQPGDRGQDTCHTSGYLGLLNWNGDMVFQNTKYTQISGDFDPTVDNIEVSSYSGTVEDKAQFNSDEPVFVQYVKNDADKVNVNVTPKSSKAAIEVTGPDGKVYPAGRNIPVNEGANYIVINSTVTGDDGTAGTLTYRVNVHRRQKDEVYYGETYRDQYHYSVKDGWANDPNGLVYYNGKYHFFYQFYDAKRWGPMHWAHTTSTDLIHWEDQPIAFCPDSNGAMFSGCIVADETNSSGLFSTDKGGLVALITADGNGQRIKLAYSEDEGRTWTKVNKIVADWSKDPLQNRDFRDPKVFRWENKWFMVLAGGPLRIYSSDNLREWKCETTYSDLHTECPDLFPIKASDGQIKWVLSRGGRFYKVGDFKQTDGKWGFVPDSQYENSDGVMNFGKDSYAAMTFYVQDFGTATNPTLPDILEVNWMNTWDNYCNDVADKVGQDFNGTFNLILKEGLVKEGGKYLLTQTPAEEYETLREAPKAELKDVDVVPGNNLLKDFSGDCYEIVSTFRPGKDTKKVGFKLRVEGDESTDVIYDLESKKLSIDRSRSGIQISGRFTDVDSQAEVEPNADGSVTLHIYVDRASVEVFSKGDTVAGANQIFPTGSNLGAEAVAEGGAAKADITIYPLKSIWNRTSSTAPVKLVTTVADEERLALGESMKANASLLPYDIAQDVEWKVANPEIVSLETKGRSAVLTGLKKGSTEVTVSSKADPSLTRTFSVKVLVNNFKTNLSGLEAGSGNWVVDDETLSVENHGSNDFYMSTEPVNSSEYTIETKVKFPYGIINLFFAGKTENPFDENAYAVQLAGNNPKVRLFRFANDGVLEEFGDMGRIISDDKYHDVKITKTKDSVAVAVDGSECLNYKFDKVEPFFNEKPYVGIGLWDGKLDVQTLYVKPIEKPADNPGGNNGDKPSDDKKPGGNNGSSSSNKIKNGSKVTVSGCVYQVISTSKKTVAYVGLNATKGKTAKSVTVPKAVKIQKKTYKVTQLNKGAFTKCKKATTVHLYAPNLTTVRKNAFSGFKKNKLTVVIHAAKKTQYNTLKTKVTKSGAKVKFKWKTK